MPRPQAFFRKGRQAPPCTHVQEEDVPLGGGVSLRAAMCVLRARALAAQDNQPRAAFWYRKALTADAYCYDAYAALIDQQMLTNEEEVGCFLASVLQ